MKNVYKLSGIVLILSLSVLFINGCSYEGRSGSKLALPKEAPIKSLIPPRPDGLRLLIFGIDGAEWDVILPLINQGRLPNIQNLIKNGTRGELESIEPMFSPRIWTTIATGKMPEKHGIDGFTVSDPESGEVIPISSQNRKTAAFWNIYSMQKWIVGMVGWLMTWPAEKVNGFNCSVYTYPPFVDIDIDPVHDQSINTVYPESLNTYTNKYIISPNNLPERIYQKQKLGALRIGYHRRYLFARDWAYRVIALDLLERYKPTVFAIYFDGVDLLSHANFPMYKWYRWVKYNEPTQVYLVPDSHDYYEYVDHPIQTKHIPGYTPKIEKYIMDQGEALENYYEFMDETLGQVMKYANESTIIALVSDHGFKLNYGGRSVKTGDEYYSQPTHWHKLLGVCIFRGPGIKKNYLIKGASVKDILPTLLYLTGYPVAMDMDGRILQEMVEDDYLKEHSEKWIQSYDNYYTVKKDIQHPARSPYDKEILERLKTLGYIQ